MRYRITIQKPDGTNGTVDAEGEDAASALALQDLSGLELGTVIYVAPMQIEVRIFDVTQIAIQARPESEIRNI